MTINFDKTLFIHGVILILLKFLIFLGFDKNFFETIFLHIRTVSVVKRRTMTDNGKFVIHDLCLSSSSKCHGKKGKFDVACVLNCCINFRVVKASNELTVGKKLLTI